MIERLIGTKFWNTYFKVYDKLTRVIPYQRLQEQNAQLVVGDRPQGRYLDLGCGTGNSTAAVAARLAQEGEVIGLDNSPAALARARQKCQDQRITFIRGDMGRALPFADQSFDGVLANNSLYLVAEPATVILDILRVLKPGGRFLLTNPGESAGAEPILLEHLAEKKMEYLREYGPVFGRTAFLLHSAEAAGSFFLLLPFQLVLKHSFNLVSHFWAADRWQAVFDEVQRTGQISFFTEPPFLAYAKQNHTFIGYRLPD